MKNLKNSFKGWLGELAIKITATIVFIKTLEFLLPNIQESVFHSIIGMCGEHKIKTKMPENVVRCIHFPKYIKKFNEIKLTQDEVKEVIHQIKKHRLPATRETHKKHIEHLKQRFNDKGE